MATPEVQPEAQRAVAAAEQSSSRAAAAAEEERRVCGECICHWCMTGECVYEWSMVYVRVRVATDLTNHYKNRIIL